jgi:6-phosphogluconate dehydrogenase
MKSQIGLIGLAVMGENLVLNMESKGFSVSVYNRTASKVEKFVEGRAKNKNINGYVDLDTFVESLESPKKIMLMVKAGEVVDTVIDQLVPYLSEGDIIIDGGNSYFKDTQRRCDALEEKGILYVGTGVSGGEEGALLGPSIMPGGHEKAWPLVKDILQAIAAKADDGTPCCDWVGTGGAGHFVKMVHNGIEYGDMQLICESYDLVKSILDLDNAELSKMYDDWNNTELDSYLIEITRDIFAKKEDGEYVIDTILDTAGQKGTGKWTGITSLELGVPVTAIAEAVYARTLSAKKEERVKASEFLIGPNPKLGGNADGMIEDVRRAVYASKIISYAQGFALMHEASNEFKWNLNLKVVASLFRAGCIIRSKFLQNIMDAYEKNPSLSNLLLDEFFRDSIHANQIAWRNIVSVSVNAGVPIPAISSSLSYFDGYRSARLPANLLQAQRDYFGAHTYERLDKKRGEFFHTNWTGKGGDTTSNQYDV